MLGILNSVLIDGIFMFPIGLFLNGVFMWYVEVFSAWIRVGIMNKFYPFADEIDIYKHIYDNQCIIMALAVAVFMELLILVYIIVKTF